MNPQLVFIENNISGDDYFLGEVVKALISFGLKVITNKDKLTRFGI